MGKSRLLENLIYQSAKQEEGLIFLDPHGDSIRNVLVQMPTKGEQDVTYLDLIDYHYPFGLNLAACPGDPGARRAVARKATAFCGLASYVVLFSNLAFAHRLPARIRAAISPAPNARRLVCSARLEENQEGGS